MTGIQAGWQRWCAATTQGGALTRLALTALWLPRRSRYFALAGGLILAAGLAAQAAPAAAATAAGRGPAQAGARQVAFRGYTFRVPRSWPVVNLAAHPRTCVLFDRDAVYLGTPVNSESCPASGVGPPAGAVLIEPAAGHARTRSAEIPVDHLITVTAPRIKLTASYGTDPAIVRRILASASLPPPVVRAPAATSGGALAAAASTNGSGVGFDACTVPSSGNMFAWKASSPYATVGIYIGGADRACSQQNLTAGWVSAQSAAGWSFIPLYVGPQAEFGQLTSPASQGTAAADDAVSQAESLGIAPGAVLYYDMEAYPSGDNSAVLTFLGAWTTELHRDQYRSGVYSSSDSGVVTLAGSYSNPFYAVPDVIYDALGRLEAHAVAPPSMTRSWPMANPASSDASQSTAAAASLTVPALPAGKASLSRWSRSVAVSPGRSDMGVSIGPGLMALIRMPSAMYSRAAARVSALTAALVAA
jgi:hypothetical protein